MKKVTHQKESTFSAFGNNVSMKLLVIVIFAHFSSYMCLREIKLYTEDITSRCEKIRLEASETQSLQQS